MRGEPIRSCGTRVLAVAALVFCSAPVAAKTHDAPFWTASAGWWVSDNTYFTPTLDYNVRAYSSLVHVEVSARQVVETEYKFWPPSKMATLVGEGLVREGEGVEQVTVTTYARTDAAGIVRQVAIEPAVALPGKVTTIRVLNADTAEKVIRDPNDPFDLYRMFITMPTPDRRYSINYGLVSAAKDGAQPGSLRGLATFHARRIQPAEFAALRSDLRTRYAVRVLVTAGADHRPKPQRID